jgi:hypothetical protein
MPVVVRIPKGIVCYALLGVLIQAAAPALQALHAAQHASEHAAADAAALATRDDFSREAFRSRAPAVPQDDDATGFACTVCKGHARLGSVLPTPRTLAHDAIGYDSRPATLSARVPGVVAHARARPRAPPVFVS